MRRVETTAKPLNEKKNGLEKRATHTPVLVERGGGSCLTPVFPGLKEEKVQHFQCPQISLPKRTTEKGET